MSKRSGCLLKRPISTLEKAKARAVDQSRRTKTSIEAYKCPHCKFWHTGHNKEI